MEFVLGGLVVAYGAGFWYFKDWKWPVTFWKSKKLQSGDGSETTL